MTTNNKIKEESYYINIYIDIYNDTVAFQTKYRFTTKELAEDFCKKLSNIQNCSIEYDYNIGYEKTEKTVSFTKYNSHRPIFNNVEEAIKDLHLCIKFCINYSNNKYIDNRSIKYLYIYNIFEINLKSFQNILLKNSNNKLYKKLIEIQDEVTMLKQEIAKLTNKN